MLGLRRTVALAAIATLVLACQGAASSPPATSPPSASPTPAPTPNPSAAVTEIRKIEKDRVAALVAGDAEAARPFFSQDYWLVDPTGGIWARDDYLAAVGSGQLDYASWDPKSDMSVRVVGDSAILRYRASIVVQAGTQKILGDFWHTDYYERVDGHWLVVWSQATSIAGTG